MAQRFDYFVVDQYGDVWNVEPLPTFKQAWDFRNYMIPQMNYPRDFKIKSTPRTVMAPIIASVVKPRPQYASSEF